MRCAKQFSLTVSTVPCDGIGDATWIVTKLDPTAPGTLAMAGGDGTFVVNAVGTPSEGDSMSAVSSSVACPRGDYTLTIEIDYNVFLEEFGAGSLASINLVARRNGAAVIFYSASAPSGGGTFSDAATLTSAPLLMDFETTYTFQIQVIYSLTGLGVCNLTGAVRLRPLIPP